MTPRFSIVIPTRERADTLRHTLRTCLAQQFDDFEIVVSDNDSSPAVREVAESFADPKIRYVRTPQLLAMTDSWEFAVARAAGEFVLVLGADDGLLLHALAEIDRVIRMTDATMLRWDSICYNWPDLPVQEYTAPNALLIPLKQTDNRYPVHAIGAADTVAMMQAAANAYITYAELPMLYCSAIHRSWLDRLRARTGRIFKSQAPDVYSAFAFAALKGSFHSVAAPMGINGLSGKSNGVACLYAKEPSAVAEEFHRLNLQAQHALHQSAPALPVMSACVADSFMHAREALVDETATVVLDRKELVKHCIHDRYCANDEQWHDCQAKLRAYLADDADLLTWFEHAYGAVPLSAVQEPPHRLKRYGGAYLNLDASAFDVTNVFEAAQLCETLLGCRRDGLSYELVTRPPTSVAALADQQRIQKLASALQDAHARWRRTNQRLQDTQGQLQEFRALGPTALRFARLFHSSAKRFPRLAHAVKGALRATAGLVRPTRRDK